jgi:hypothetical protein
VSLSWSFDTKDQFNNDYGGWQIDDVEVIVSPLACVDPCPGDLDGDYDVDIFDFGQFAAGFAILTNATRANGDLDGDGDVDIFDFGLFAAAFGINCNAP